MGMPLAHRRFTVDEYHRMAEVGILGEDDRVELLDGEIVEMSPIGSRHAAAVTRLQRLLGRLAGDRAIVRVQQPVRLDSYSEPEPDVAVVEPRDDFYAAPTQRDAYADREILGREATLTPWSCRTSSSASRISSLEGPRVPLTRPPSRAYPRPGAASFR